MKVEQSRCRWVLIVTPGGNGAASEPPASVPESGPSDTSRWVYVCHRKATDDLFARYRRRRHRPAKVLAAASAAGRNGPEESTEATTCRRRACPRCNGWVDRVPRRFVDGPANILNPVHRYRCRSSSCGWEGNLRVQRDSLPSLRRGAPEEGSNGTARPLWADSASPSGQAGEPRANQSASRRE